MRLSVAFLSLCLVVSSGKSFAAQSMAKSGPSGVVVAAAVAHADREKAEICLSFDSPVQIKDRSRAAAALDFRKSGKRVKLGADQISFSETELCAQGLEHRATYDVLLNKMDFASGERLAKPFVGTVQIPDRKPSLTFVESDPGAAMPRHVRLVKDKAKNAVVDSPQAGMAHVLRSVNVMATHLSLYRIAGREEVAGAWQQFRKINIAPTESLYFAKTKGQMVFESDLVFGDRPNIDQTLVAPLPEDASLQPGLYYLAAAPRGKSGADVALSAGQWFLVSDLHVSVFTTSSGFKVFASRVQKDIQGAAAVDVLALDSEGKVLAETKTGADGVATVSLSAGDKAKVAYVVGQLASGELDIHDLSVEPQQQANAEPFAIKANVRADQFSYVPGAKAVFTLRAVNSKGAPTDVGESIVKLLYADRRVYSEAVVAGGKAAPSFVEMGLPVSGTAGTWFVSWSKKDGSLLAEQPIRIAPEGAVSHVSLDADRLSLSQETQATITVRALDKDGKPVSFRNGHLILSSALARIEGWSGFGFGDLTAVKEAMPKKVPFMTGADGTARLPVSLADAGQALQGVKIEAVVENSSKSRPVTLPVRTRETMVGVRPQLNGRETFPENSYAVFDIAAVDMSGKRRAEENLYYVIYEEGRSFEWFPAEGHWDYKPLPTHRRAGGGRLDVSAAQDAVVRWPVTSGQYVLEITAEDGSVMARYPFSAGRYAKADSRPQGQRIKWASDLVSLDVRQDNKVKLSLSSPAMVSVVVNDGQARESIHKFLREGENEVSLAPTEAWGNRVEIQARAVFSDGLAEKLPPLIAEVHNPSHDIPVKIGVTELSSTASLTVPASLPKTPSLAKTKVMGVASFISENGEQISPVKTEAFTPDADGRVELKIDRPSFDGVMRLSVYAWNETQSGEAKASVRVQPSVSARAIVPDSLRLGDKVTLPVALSTTQTAQGPYAYEVKGPEGVALSGNIKGSIVLKKGMAGTISVSLLAKDQTDGELSVEIKGPAGETARYTWPLYVRSEQITLWDMQQTTLAPDKSATYPLAEAKEKARALFVSPVAVPDITAHLQNIVLSEPRTTQELGLWLEVMPLWANHAADLGLLSKSRFEALRSARLLELQLRQNDDGGFPVLKAGEPSDLASTAAALRVLSETNKRAAAVGGDWLTERLRNTWFKEEERAARAQAFESMAKLKRADISGLRYFAETCRDKPVNKTTAALLALALVESGDDAAAQPWLDKARSVSGDDAGAWLVMRALAANVKLSGEDAKRIFSSLDFAKVENDYEGYVNALAALSDTAERQGSWQLSVADQSEKRFGVVTLPLSGASPKAIKNVSQQDLFVYQLSGSTQKKKASREESLAVQRLVYDLSGAKFSEGDHLEKGQTYLLYLKGAAAPSGLRISIPYSSAFSFVSPLDGEAGALRAAYGWLPNPLTTTQDAVNTTTGFGFDIDAAKEWGAVVMFRPSFKGEFSLPLLRVRGEEGLTATTQNLLRFIVD